jgi:primosomal protein N'
LEASVPYAWQKKGETIVIGTQKSRRLNVLGILDADGGLNSYTFECSIDTCIIVAYIDEFSA